jgi:hypothetical protein
LLVLASKENRKKGEMKAAGWTGKIKEDDEECYGLSL